MKIGVPKEIKVHEYRVGLTPPSVAELVAAGHEVFVETGAGAGIDFDDAAYAAVGAQILGTAAEVFKAADMIVKVKEPQAREIALLEARPKVGERCAAPAGVAAAVAQAGFKGHARRCGERGCATHGNFIARV